MALLEPQHCSICGCELPDDAADSLCDPCWNDLMTRKEEIFGEGEHY